MPDKVRASSMYGEIKALQQFPLRKETNDIINYYDIFSEFPKFLLKISIESKKEIVSLSSDIISILDLTHVIGSYGGYRWNLIL